ncbi:MAG: reverse transcriptase-like protein, partial [bacterium]|nr:reverse transcriptase-like protein [bacterium]
YKAVIFALKKTKALFGKDKIKNIEVEVRSDSELLIKQLNGEYKVVEPRIQQLFIGVWNLKIDFGKIKFTLIPREKNEEADRLANEALDGQTKVQKLF